MTADEDETKVEPKVEQRDPETIRRDIRETTAELTETIDALQDKLTPEVLAAEAREKAIDGVQTVRNRVIASARRHPVAASLVGLAALWLVGRSFVGGKAQLGGGIFSVALGAAVGIGVYRAVMTEKHLDDDESILEAGGPDMEADVNRGPLAHATLG